MTRTKTSTALQTLFVAAMAAVVAISFACGGKTDASDDLAAGGGQGTQAVTAALLDSMPSYSGATLVREWLADENRVQVREYAVAQPPAQAADAVTRHYRDALVAQGWEESEARAAVSSFTKDGRRIVIGRVGPQLQEAPAGSNLLARAEPPSGSAFFFTLEASE